MESVRDATTRLITEAVGYLTQTNKSYPNAAWRNGRLTTIAVWLGRNGPGNTAVTGAPYFQHAVMAYLAYEPWLPGSAQPFDVSGYGAIDIAKYGLQISGWPPILDERTSFMHTGRWYILDAMTKLSGAELNAWGWNTYGIPASLPKIVSTDPNLETRVKALELLDKSPLPVTIYAPLMGAITQMRSELGGTLRGSAALHQEAVTRMNNLYARLESQQLEARVIAQNAEVAAYAAAAAQGNAAAAARVPTLPPPFDWKPWATLGVTLGLVGGVVVALRRRARSAPRAAAPAALAAALPPVRQRLPAGSTVVLPSGKRAKVATVAAAAGLIEAAGGGGRRHGAVRTGDVLDARGQRLAHVTASGAAKQADRSRELAGGLGRASSALTYRPVGAKAEPYPGWVKDTKGKSGVYVIKQGGKVVYVGESHTGKLYQTMTRHFQTWTRQKKFWAGQYSSEHDPGVVYPRDAVEVAVRVLPAAQAIDAEEQLITKLKPRDNLVGQDEAPF